MMNQIPNEPVYIDGFQPLSAYKARHGGAPLPRRVPEAPKPVMVDKGNGDRTLLIVLFVLLAENGAGAELLLALVYLLL